MNGTRKRSRGSGLTGLHAAVTTAAIPAVILPAVAPAPPAAAAPAPQVSVARPLVKATPPLPRTVTPAAHVVVQVPAQPITVAMQPAPAEYTIKAGDTISAIAARHGLSTDALLKPNALDARTIISPGQKIKLSGAAAPTAVPAAKPVAAPATAPAPAPAAGTYTVKSGDTLGAIASRNGVNLQNLLTANNLSMTSIIYPGQKLTLSGAAAPTAVPAAVPAATNQVPSSFLGYTYPDRVVADANANKALLDSMPAPSAAQMRQIVADTARSMGVDPSLALAFAYQESGFNQRAVSPANAIGTMQVIPSSGQWAGDLVGRKLNLLDPHDNVTAGVAIIRSLVRTSPSLDIAIASYYQGQYSVQTRGMFEDTKRYVAAIKAHQRTFQ
ncbi:hypothetical protein AC792_14025 [Arthrobacter sp. RIT-PI-e]|nr:hypothetical protein AC792_14025 [Arthrobacter sp. RIT-PI-e]